MSEVGDMILSLVTLVLILLFMFNPLFRKLLKSASGSRASGEKPPERGEDRMYESTDCRRVVRDLTKQAEKRFVIRQPEISPVPAAPAGTEECRLPEGKGSLRKDADLKKAWLWKEILGPPAALRPPQDHRF